MGSSTKNKLNTEIGKEGEEKAVAFLSAIGYRILERNYRYKRAEIDVIASFGNEIIFFEVKKRKNGQFGSPEDFVSDAQQERIHMAATYYQEENNWNGNIRFDIISIEGNNIEHFEDAF